MRSLAFSPMVSFSSQFNQTAAVQAAPVITEPAPKAPTAALASTNMPCCTRQRLTLDRAAVITSVAIIVALLDVALILWICPVADQLAEWAGVSMLTSTYIGVIAAAASVPLVLIASGIVMHKLLKV